MIQLTPPSLSLLPLISLIDFLLKTAVAASLALESDAPFIKLISAENMVGYSESSKISYTVKVFDDAYKVSSGLLCSFPLSPPLELTSLAVLRG